MSTNNDPEQLSPSAWVNEYTRRMTPQIHASLYGTIDGVARVRLQAILEILDGMGAVVTLPLPEPVTLPEEPEQ